MSCLPLLKDLSDNVTIDLSARPLKTYVDGSLKIINAKKQNIFTCMTPLIKMIFRIIKYWFIWLLLSSTASTPYATKTNLNTKQNKNSFSKPLINDISTNIIIDLSAYPLKTYVGGSLNTINTTLSNKQNIITAVTSLTNDIGNKIAIDLSSNPLKTYVDGPINAINTTLGTKNTI